MEPLFGQHLGHLNAVLSQFISAKTTLVAAAIEPAFVTCGVIYVMGWGYLHLRGMIQEPIMEGIRRILTLAIIIGVGINLWMYHEIITDTFFVAPDKLAAAIAGAPGVMSGVDKLWYDANLIGEALSRKGTVLNSDIVFYLASLAVYGLMGLVAAYITFLFILAKVGLAVTLALGPLFIAMLLFDTTKRFFEAWAAQLANYALVAIVALTTAALMLAIIKPYATAAVSREAAITVAETARVCVTAMLVLLVLAQVKSIAAGLSGGVALTTYGAFGALVNWGLGGAKRTAYDFGRGVIDGVRREPFGRYDSLRRGAGNLAGRGVAKVYDKVARRNRTGGTIVPSDRDSHSTADRKTKP